MIKILLFASLLIGSCFGYSAKGMVAYKKLCSHCHGPAFKGAAMLFSEEWDEVFKNRAKKLKYLHKTFPKAIKKIESNYFKRRSQYLKNFLHNNARYMGVVRSCDGLNCG